MNTIKVIVFDWDGTLFDSMGYKPVNAGRVFAEEFHCPHDEVKALLLKHSGLPRRTIFKKICEHYSLPVDNKTLEGLSQKFTEYNIESAKKSALHPDVLETLQVLSGKWPLYISSASAADELARVVDSCGIAGLFKEVFGSSPGFEKGAGHFNRICEAQGCQASDILFVGDDEQDAVIAKSSGVRFVRILRGKKDTTRDDDGGVISDLKMLMTLKNLVPSS
ncbi:MAG: HAD family hydrolase [Deltaproteobacteria bacterium]|nr:HAD family hydrolase [Deltaproteobacteria bacterium]